MSSIMADKAFKLSIYTQAKRVFEADDVTSVQFPASDGQMGVLYNHAPMIAVLGEGPILVERGGGNASFKIAGGFFEIADNEASILTDRFAEV